MSGVAGLLFTAYALLLIKQLVTGFPRFGFDILVLLLLLYATTGAVLCGWFALRGDRPASRRHIGSTMKGGVITGAVGFAAGFMGPLLFAPESNQGPLLGIFLTGPVGFVLGAATGWVIGRSKHSAR